MTTALEREEEATIASERRQMKARWASEIAEARTAEAARRETMNAERQKVLRDNARMRAERAEEKLRENEFDNLLLKQSLDKDRRAEEREQAEKKRLRDEARAFQKFLEEQMIKEASNDNELEAIRQREQDKMWEKRERQWKAEAEARAALAAEVARTREKQIGWKAEARAREQAEVERLHAVTMARVAEEEARENTKAELARQRRQDQDRHIKSQMRERENGRRMKKQAEYLEYKRTQHESRKHEAAMRAMQAKAIAELEEKRRRGLF